MMQEEEYISVKTRGLEKLRRDLGPMITDSLNDAKTVEIMLNADGKLWQERLGEKMCCIGTLTPARAEAIIKTIAGLHGQVITRLNPILEGELPLDGSRFAAQIPPVASAPVFAIRKKAISIFTLDDYVTAKIMTKAQAAAIEQAVRAHRNILIVGGTGSGKTTLVNAIIETMVRNDPKERVFIMEDTGEIQCSAENFVQYHTSPDVSMTRLLKTSLRMRPDRILVGEVRGEEALDLLDAWNTGHEGGAATLHANSAIAGLTRLKSLISRNKAAPSNIEALIAEAVHVVIHITRTESGRCIRQILEISGFENGQYIFRQL